MKTWLGVLIGSVSALSLGGVAYEVWSHKKGEKSGKLIPAPGLSLDPGMDTYTAAVVSRALSSETDTSILDKLADALKAAGYTVSANAVGSRSQTLKKAVAAPTTSVKGLLTGCDSALGVCTGALAGGVQAAMTAGSYGVRGALGIAQGAQGAAQATTNAVGALFR